MEYTYSNIHFLSEFVGTFLIVLLGNGVCSSITFSKMKSNNPAKWILVVIGWSLAVFWGFLASNAIANSPTSVPNCLNPAVTLFKAISYQNGYKLLMFIPIQFLGAIIAQIIVDFVNWRHIIDETKPINLLEIHSTFPAYSYSENGYKCSFLHEFLGTTLLICMLLILRNTHTLNIKTIYQEAIAIALIIVAILCSWGSQTGAALNPARDIGPRLVYRFLLIPFYINNKKNNNHNSFEIKELEEKLINTTNWSHGLLVATLAPMMSGLMMGMILYFC